MLSVVLLLLKTSTFSIKDSAKTLSSICMLIAQLYKDTKNFRQRDNTHGVLNVKFRLNIPAVQDSENTKNIATHTVNLCLAKIRTMFFITLSLQLCMCRHCRARKIRLTSARVASSSERSVCSRSRRTALPLHGIHSRR